jgi:hypothetical protein
LNDMDATVGRVVRNPGSKREQKSLQLTRGRIVVAILFVAIVIVIAGLVNAFILTPATIKRPVAPASVAAIRDQWGYDILLPTFKPACLTYDENGADVRQDLTAGSGQVLQVTLGPVPSASCADASGSVVRITEALTLASLEGKVSTVSHGRMQFAQVTETTSGGRTDVTLQWHCLNIMCRMVGTTSAAISEDVLAQMADSFQVIEPLD